MDLPAPPEVEVVTGLAGFAERALQVAGAARTELALLTYAFDARVYGTEPFVDTVRRFALEHRRARLRVLINQPALAMRRAHRLVELGRLLASRIEFRELLDERKPGVFEELLIADERTLVHRPSAESLEAKHWPNAPLEARSRLRGFNALWEESVPARELANLRL